MKVLNTLIVTIILIASASEALTVKKIDRYAGIDYKPIEQLYCSIGEKKIKFQNKHQYRTVSIKLFSTKSNSIVKIVCPEHVIIRESIVKILKGEEKRISMHVTPFNGEVEVEFQDHITKEEVSKLLIVGELDKLYLQQRTTFSKSNTSIRLNHSIRYKDWGMNVGGSQREMSDNFEYNLSVSKQW